MNELTQAHVATIISTEITHNERGLSANRHSRMSHIRGLCDNWSTREAVVRGALGGLRLDLDALVHFRLRYRVDVDAQSGIVMVPWNWGAGRDHVCGTSGDTVDNGRSGC